MKKRDLGVMGICILMIGSCFILSCKKDVNNEKKQLIVMTEDIAEPNVNNAALFFEELHPEFDVKIEMPPKDPGERSAYLHQWNAKMIAGKGPDVYVLNTSLLMSSLDSEKKETLIKNVNKTIQSGAFASLDIYMKKDEFWKKRAYKKEFLEAGKYQGRQYILPLSCTFDVLCGTEDGTIVNGKNFQEIYKNTDPFTLSKGSGWIQPALDYEEEKLIFDEKQWKSFAIDYLSRLLINDRKEEDIFPYYTSEICLAMDQNAKIYGNLPDLNGRKMAVINWYGGVGMSSKYKEEAYEFLMLFLNERYEKQDNTVIGSVKNFWDIPVMEDDRYFPEYPQVLSCFQELEGAFFPTDVEQYINDEVWKIVIAQKEWIREELEAECTSLASKIKEKYRMIIEE